jgi:hypothetical protein
MLRTGHLRSAHPKAALQNDQSRSGFQQGKLGSDKVFDVIGRLFENVSLKSYLDAAIRGEDVADGIEGEGRKQAAEQLELVKTRHSALSKVREARLAEIRAEPGQVVLGPVRFIAHALIVHSLDAEDTMRFDAEVEAVAVKLAMAHEENANGRVRDVSTAARARAAGLSDFPGFDLLSERPADAVRCIEVKGLRTPTTPRWVAKPRPTSAASLVPASFIARSCTVHSRDS